MEMTYVFNLLTGVWERSYTLPPEEAVVAAFYESRGNYNWWAWDKSLVRYGPSGMTVFCGNFSAMLDRCPLF